MGAGALLRGDYANFPERSQGISFALPSHSSQPTISLPCQPSVGITLRLSGLLERSPLWVPYNKVPAGAPK